VARGTLGAGTGEAPLGGTYSEAGQGRAAPPGNPPATPSLTIDSVRHGGSPRGGSPFAVSAAAAAAASAAGARGAPGSARSTGDIRLLQDPASAALPWAGEPRGRGRGRGEGQASGVPGGREPLGRGAPSLCPGARNSQKAAAARLSCPGFKPHPPYPSEARCGAAGAFYVLTRASWGRAVRVIPAVPGDLHRARVRVQDHPQAVHQGATPSCPLACCCCCALCSFCWCPGVLLLVFFFGPWC